MARAKPPRSAGTDAPSTRPGARRRGDDQFPAARPGRGRDDIDPALLPSRVAILDALKVAGVPLPPADLARQMDVEKRARDAFFGRIDAMQRDGELLKNRKGELCVIAKLDFITGSVQGHPDGFGFLVPDDGSPDLFLCPAEMHKVLHGDRATARRSGTDRRGRPEGPIVDVLERANQTIVGRLYEERGITFVVAENRRINQDLLVPPDERGGAKSGDVVVVEIVQQPSPQREAIARVIEVLGSDTDPGMEIEIALRKHDLPHEFSLAARKQAGKLPAEVTDRDRDGRIDLTALPLVTIDGETAKDFDDAVWCERKGKGFRLVVAIADVSALRARRRSARPRRARARHVGLLPAPRDSDAPGGAVERALLAQARRRPAVHGLRHGHHGAGEDHAVPRSIRR